MPFLDSGDARLYYEVHGSGDEDVVFAHGRGGNHFSWWRQLPAFSKRYRCVVFDHRSFGLSTAAQAPGGQQRFAGDLLRLLDHLGINKAHLVAQSMGGRTCLDLALAHPARVGRLVLADTIAGVVDAELTEILERFGSPPKDLMQRVLSAGFRSRDPELAFLYAQIEALNHATGTPIQLERQGPGQEQLRRCTAPTLLVVGDEDTIAPVRAVEWLTGHLPSARMAVIEGAGHSAYFEKPQEFNSLVLAFLGKTGA
jgi:3-oxoadipate enol-lactonase